MSDQPRGDLSCTAKLVRVVLSNQGPLSPSEVAAEARISAMEARESLVELADHGLAHSVCGLCRSQEEVYELDEDAAGEQAGEA